MPQAVSPDPIFSLATRWRDATRRCLIVGFNSHKGGQGRTLLCSHVAMQMLMGVDGPEGRNALSTFGRPRKILALDYDWTAPGLSYMLTSAEGILPQKVQVVQEPKGNTTDILWEFDEMARTLEDTTGDVTPRQSFLKKLATAQGSPLEGEAEVWFDSLKTLLGDVPGKLGVIESRDDKDESRFRSRLYFLPALSISHLDNAVRVFSFEERILGGKVIKDPEIARLHSLDPYFAWIQRALLFYLIEALKLDFVLIDSQAGLWPSNWYTAGLIADLVWLPTTVFSQALEGTGTLANLLCAAREGDNSTGLKFGPLHCEPVLSNVALSLLEFTGDRAGTSTRYLHPKPAVLDHARTFLGRERAPFFWLPHVEGLTRGETFIHNLSDERSDDNVVDIYRKNIQGIVDVCDTYQRQKLQAQYVFPTVRARAKRRAAILIEGSGHSITILVEEGPFGEEPFKRLSKDIVAAGFDLRVKRIEHDILFEQVVKALPARPIDAFKGVDIAAFPHYLLGSLVTKELIVPLASLSKDAGGASLLEDRWLSDYLLAEETCFHNGALYAFPFSALRKLLVVPRDYVGATGGWSMFADSLAASGAKIALENDFDRVGPWYDWLELVNAHGGTDFRRNTSTHGADYGACWLANPATVDGTLAYLRLFWRGLAAPGEHKWDRVIDEVLRGKALACFAWSDILGYQWTTNAEAAEALRFCEVPPATPTPNRSIVEGWVIGVPSNNGTVDQNRKGLAEAFMAWFLSEEVQVAFARCGGSPSLRSLTGRNGNPVLTAVHQSLASRPTEPKISFSEAPQVQLAIRSALKKMVGWSNPMQQTRQQVEAEMRALAEQVSERILGGKAPFFLPPTQQRGA